MTGENYDAEEDQEVYVRYVAPPSRRLIVKRNGSSITRKIPKPTVLVDTREQSPFDFSRFPNWIAEGKRQKLNVGDYSVQGMEDLLLIERKTLSDLITTVMQQRVRFFRMCEKMSHYRWKALFVGRIRVLHGSTQDVVVEGILWAWTKKPFLRRY